MSLVLSNRLEMKRLRSGFRSVPNGTPGRGIAKWWIGALRSRNRWDSF
jgi:hypothetical protein